MAFLLDMAQSTISRALSGGPALPFTIGAVSDSTDVSSIWTIHKGTKKDDGSPVTVFIFDCVKHKDKLALAKNAIKRFKTIRHPDMLKYIDGAETESQIIIGTEYVVPLHEQVQGTANPNFISWGLYKIATAIKFLNADCSLTHGNVRMSSIYVTKAGEWRLGGMELICSIKEDHPILFDWGGRMPEAWKYAPPELLNNAWSSSASNPISSIDAWCFGCLIYELFNEPISRREALAQGGKIPRSLLPRYRGLTHNSPKLREDLSQLLERASTGNGYFVNDFIQATLFLEQISVKDASEKDQFFRTLTTTLDDFPADFCAYKILPELMNALEFGGAGAKALTPILKIGAKLNSQDFEALLLPSIVKLFASPDRVIRITLCENLGSFIEHMSGRLVNDKIFVNLATGFLDTNAIIREATLKSVLVLMPKLNERIVNNDLLRYLAKLQTDEEPGIRANTTICLGKISRNLNEMTRKKVLIPAFGRSLNDPFPPARNAGLLALYATTDLYHPVDVAQRILPMTSPLLIDPERSIRAQAFKNVEAFLKKLEAHSSEMADPVAPPKPTAAQPPSLAASSANVAGEWAGWALGAITTRLTTSATTSQPPTGAATSITSPAKSTAFASSSTPGSPRSNSADRPPSLGRTGSGASISQAFSTDPAVKSDGWDDDDNWGAEPHSTSPTTSPFKAATALPNKPSPLSFPAKKKGLEGWEEWTEDGGGLAAPAAPPVPAAKVSTSAGWDNDWDNDVQKPESHPLASFGGLSGTTALGGSEAERAKKREQMAALREKKKAALAAKKAAMGNS
ncbi:armadillo-type protein [Zopfochytrium polystomum]|nr:armadillo-type protein [Zopfochytrium polystomum]